MTSIKCSFSECDREPYAQGYCFGHYQQKKRGRPLTQLRPYRSPSTARIRVTLRLPPNVAEHVKANYAGAVAALEQWVEWKLSRPSDE